MQTGVEYRELTPPRERPLAVTLYLEGVKTNEITMRTGVSRARLYAMLRREGFEPSRIRRNTNGDGTHSHPYGCVSCVSENAELRLRVRQLEAALRASVLFETTS